MMQSSDAIVASGPPFSTFVAAYYISRRHRKPLVLDYRDEWSETPFKFVQNTPFGRRWEARCLAHASRVIYTTQSQKQHAISVFGGDLAAKAVVFPNGWDETHKSEAPVARPTRRPGDFEILFAGAVGTHTPFHLFLTAFSKLINEGSENYKTLKLSILGNQSPDVLSEMQSSDASGRISFESQVAVTEVIGRLNRSQVALLISTEDFERYIPGKLYYYMASDRPVLVYGAPGEAQRIVEETGAGTFVPEGDAAALFDAIQGFVSGPENKWNTEARQTWTHQHTRAQSARALYSLLDELTGPVLTPS